MKHPAARRSKTSASPAVEQLVEIRDDLAVATSLSAAVYMASHALDRGSERSAMCELTNTCRERLEAIILRIDKMLAEASRRPGKAASADTPGNEGRRKGP